MSLEEAQQTAPGDRPKATIFISYSRRDLAFADRIDAALKARGFHTLIDRSEIYALEDWWKRIEGLIAQADTVVFILSPDAIASDVCQSEVRFAASLNKRLAPIVFRRVEDKAVPPELARLNFIFFDDPALFDASLDRLAEALETDIDWVRKHTEFGELARRWASAGRPGPRGLLLRPPVLDEAERWIASRPHNGPMPTEATQSFITVSRQAHTRRRNIVSGSLAAGLFVALSLAGLAAWQWRAAAIQRARAEDTLYLAMGWAKAHVMQVGALTILAKTSDSAALPTLIKTMAKNFLELSANLANALEKYSGDSPRIRQGQAAILSDFADVLIKSGDAKRALAEASRARDILKPLTEADPGDATALGLLAESETRIGDARIVQGRRSEAVDSYRGALSIYRRLASRDPAKPEWSVGTALCLLTLARLDSDPQADLTEALAVVRQLDAAGRLPAEYKPLVGVIESSLAQTKSR